MHGIAKAFLSVRLSSHRTSIYNKHLNESHCDPWKALISVFQLTSLPRPLVGWVRATSSPYPISLDVISAFWICPWPFCPLPVVMWPRWPVGSTSIKRFSISVCLERTAFAPEAWDGQRDRRTDHSSIAGLHFDGGGHNERSKFRNGRFSCYKIKWRSYYYTNRNSHQEIKFLQHWVAASDYTLHC